MQSIAQEGILPLNLSSSIALLDEKDKVPAQQSFETVEKRGGVSLLILSDAPTLEIDGDFPASVIGSPGTTRSKTVGMFEEYPSLMSITSEARIRQQSEPPVPHITLINKVFIPARTLDLEQFDRSNKENNKKLLPTLQEGGLDPLMISKHVEKSNKEEMTQRWLLEQSGEDEMSIFKTNNKHSSHISVAISEPGEDEKRSYHLNTLSPTQSDLKRVSIDFLTFKGLHTLIRTSPTSPIQSHPTGLQEQNQDFNAAFASSEIDVKDDNLTRDDEEVNEESKSEIHSKFVQEDGEAPHASLGCALSFLVLYQGKEGQFWISERYLNRFRYDHLVRLCLRCTSDASLSNDDTMQNLQMHIVLSDPVSNGLGLQPNHDGLNLVQIERWTIGEHLSLQYLLFKNFLLLVAQREGSIRILCSDKRQELPKSLTASRKFWQSRSQDPTCSHEIGRITVTADVQEQKCEPESSEVQSAKKKVTMAHVQQSTQTEKDGQNAPFCFLDTPLSPADQFLRSVRGLSSVSYTFSSLEHALDDVIVASGEEQIMSPPPVSSTSPGLISDVNILQRLEDIQEANKHSTRDKCLSSRFSEESDREHLNDECENIEEKAQKEEEKSITMLSRIPSISKKHIKIGLSNFRNRSRSNSDVSGTGTAPKSGENDSDSASSIVSRSSSFVVKIHAQRQALENAASKTLKRLQTAKNKHSYANQWTGYIKRPHTSAGEHSVNDDASVDVKDVHQKSLGEREIHSTLFRRRRGAPISLDLNREDSERDQYDHQRVTPLTPTPNILGLDRHKTNSPTPSTPSIHLPAELINRSNEHVQTQQKPLPAVPSDVFDDGHTIDASQPHVHFQTEPKRSHRSWEEVCENHQSSKMNLPHDRDEMGSESSHQTNQSNLSSSLSNHRTGTIETSSGIGSSPAFIANAPANTLSGISLSRLIPFKVKTKDLRNITQIVKQKVDQRSDLCCETSINSDLHKSPENKEKGYSKTPFLLSRNESVEDVARYPGKPLLLPLQQCTFVNDESSGSNTTPTRLTSHIILSSPQSVQFAQRQERPKTGFVQQRGFDDRTSVSEYSLASPITYSFASNDMNTPSSISTSFISTPSPINGWKICSENREPAVRDCVSSLSTSAPLSAGISHRDNHINFAGSDQSHRQGSFRDKSMDEGKQQQQQQQQQQQLHSTVYSSTKNVKRKPSNATEKSVQRIPNAIRSIGTSRSFDLLRRTGSNSPQSTANNLIENELYDSKDSKQNNRLRRKSSLGLQSSNRQSNQTSLQQDRWDDDRSVIDSIGRSSPRGNFLRRLRTNTVVENDISSKQITSSPEKNTFRNADGYDRSQQQIPPKTKSSPHWTLVATGLEETKSFHQSNRKVFFESEIVK